MMFAAAEMPGHAQDDSSPPILGPSQGRRTGNPAPPPDELQRQAQADAAKKANQNRQAQLKRDTERLFELANELKQYVDKTNENILSIDVIKKADEIEKLAHSIREKMKGS